MACKGTSEYSCQAWVVALTSLFSSVSAEAEQYTYFVVASFDLCSCYKLKLLFCITACRYGSDCLWDLAGVLLHGDRTHSRSCSKSLQLLLHTISFVLCL